MYSQKGWILCEARGLSGIRNKAHNIYSLFSAEKYQSSCISWKMWYLVIGFFFKLHIIEVHRSAISSLLTSCCVLRWERYCTCSLLLDTFLTPLINVLLLGHINFLCDASGTWRRSWVSFDTRSCLMTVYSDNTEEQTVTRIDTTRATFLYDLENDGHDDGLFKIWWE